MKILYFDCFSGASGDMILGALLDAGASLTAIKSELAKLPLSGYELKTAPVSKKGIAALSVTVEVQEGQQPHRHYSDIKAMLLESELSPPVRELSLAVFARLAAAEGKVHQQPLEHVHFHEVGAVDSIVDIVGAAAAFADLAADKIYASALHTGCGTVRCAHGELPVPAPATLEVLAGAPIYARGIEGELLTPTGAAILATVAEFSSLPTMTVQRTGYGAGQKDLPIANVLRVIVGETDTQSDYHRGTVTVLETTIDDMNPEFYGHVMEQLLKAGAVDVTMAPIHMKKNRPGILLTVLVHAPHEEAVVTTLFNETTTLGMRRTTAEKLMLARRQQTVETHYGPVRIKIGEMDSDVRNASPEYEDCASLARQHNVPIKTIYMMALTAYTKTITT